MYVLFTTIHRFFSEIWSHGAPEGDGLYIAMIVVLSIGNGE